MYIVRADLQTLYAGELNPVGPKAQKKVSISLLSAFGLCDKNVLVFANGPFKKTIF